MCVCGADVCGRRPRLECLAVDLDAHPPPVLRRAALRRAARRTARRSRAAGGGSARLRPPRRQRALGGGTLRTHQIDRVAISPGRRGVARHVLRRGEPAAAEARLRATPRPLERRYARPHGPRWAASHRDGVPHLLRGRGIEAELEAGEAVVERVAIPAVCVWLGCEGRGYRTKCTRPPWRPSRLPTPHRGSPRRHRSMCGRGNTGGTTARQRPRGRARR